MNLKTSLTAAILMAPLASQGQATLSFADNKTYRQVAPRESVFEGGSLTTSISDGVYTIAGCVGNGGLFRMTPNIFCPLGTTGFVTAGDVDGDLIRDTNQYFSVSQILAAQQVEPFQTQRISLVAAPPSTLNRPIGGQGWTDASIVIWFDQINFPIQAYELTRYSTARNYLANQLQLQYDEIVPGTYIYETPLLNDDLRSFIIRITHLQMIEAWPGRGLVPTINDFTLLNDELWNDGAVEIDPRLFNRFDWRGFNGNTAIATDTTDFSLVSREDIFFVNVDDNGLPFEDVLPEGSVLFPPYDILVPVAERFPERIATPSSSYEVGPFFFIPGDEVTAVIDFNRSLTSTANSRDTSSRTFTWNVNFVDTYEGFLVTAFEQGFLPGTTPDAYLDPYADFDGDGYTNIEEYALDVDAIEPGTVGDDGNFVPVPTFNPADVPLLTPVLDPITQQCIFEVPKRPLVGDRVTYQVQYTTDLVTWTTITQSDPVWFIETNDEEIYRVRSRQPAPPATCLVRVLITAN